MATKTPVQENESAWPDSQAVPFLGGVAINDDVVVFGKQMPELLRERIIRLWEQYGPNPELWQ